MYDHQTYSEEALLLKISQGEETAFRQLYNVYSSRLYQYIVSLTRRQDLAEDLVQNIFLKLWHRRATLPAIHDFSAYLFRMAKNDVITAVQRAALENALLQKGLPHPAPEQLPDEQLQAAQIRDAWKKAIQNLPPQQQKIYILQKEYGWKIRDIARLLDLSTLTIKRHLAISKQAVRLDMMQKLSRKELLVILFLGALHGL